jgi:hypothetical protein
MASTESIEGSIGIGSVVVLHSLQSAHGQTLNGKRAIVLHPAKEGQRWTVKVEGKQYTETSDIKPANMQISTGNDDDEDQPEYVDLVAWQLAHYEAGRGDAWEPEYRRHRNARGVAYEDTPPPQRARKMVELLDKRTDGHDPGGVVLVGESIKFYRTVGDKYMEADCTIDDRKHIAGMVALAAMCQGEAWHAVGCGDGEVETVLLAFLEKIPTSLDVLMEFVVLTPFLGTVDEFQGDSKEAFRKLRNDAFDNGNYELTPDQSSRGYFNAMKGPLGMLYHFGLILAQPKCCSTHLALFYKMEQHKLFPYFVQRLFRLAAREVMGTKDGTVLGHYVRNILACMWNYENQLDPARYLQLVKSNESFDRNLLSYLLRIGTDIQSLKDLAASLDVIMDRQRAEKFMTDNKIADKIRKASIDKSRISLR